MLNTLKNQIILSLAVFVVFSLTSNVWADQDRHGHDRGHHERHYYPELTLISGMDNIDSKILIASDASQPPLEVASPETVIVEGSLVRNQDFEDNYFVNVPNTAGGYTPIRIQKSGNGYEGPNGEFYYPFPEASQLKAMYRL